MDWRTLPKVELHLHLDCSLSYDVVSRIDPAITREEYDTRFVGPSKCADLKELLSYAPPNYPLMQTEEQLRLVTLDLFEQLRRDNVIYAEFRYAPLLHTEKGLSPRQVVAAVEAATAEGVRTTGIEARNILCTLAFYSTAQSLETVRLVEEFQGTFVAGFDIAADHPVDPITAHIPAFRYAREQGIPYTAHAGESRGAENVWRTVQDLRPQRLGHGVPCLENPLLVDHLLEHQIHLEICPGCNVQSDVFHTYADHPIDTLHRMGMAVSVNTDTRTMCGTTLSQEYARMHETFGWGADEFYATNIHALTAAFAPEEVRTRLKSRLAEGYGRAG